MWAGVLAALAVLSVQEIGHRRVNDHLIVGDYHHIYRTLPSLSPSFRGLNWHSFAKGYESYHGLFPMNNIGGKDIAIYNAGIQQEGNFTPESSRDISSGYGESFQG